MRASVNVSHMGRWALWLTYVAIIAFVSMHHEPWRDEVDAWLMVRYANLHEFIAYFSYTGHPPLWYLVNLPFARWLGLPMKAQAWLPLLCAATLVWLLLFRSRFPLWLLVPCIFSVHLLFQYAILARSYPLLLLLLFVVPVLHPTRFAHPLRYAAILALLFWTELYAWSAAAMLTAFFMADCLKGRHSVDPPTNRVRFGAIVLPLLAAVIAVALLWPRADANPMRGWRFHFLPSRFLDAVLGGFVPLAPFATMLAAWLPSGIVSALGSAAAGVLIAIIVLSIVVLTAVSLWRSRALWLFAAWAAGFFVIINFIYRGFFWHWGMIPIFLLFTCWFAEADAAPARVGAQRLLYGLLAITFTASAAIGASVAAYEVRYPYSGAPAVAAYLQTEAAAGVPIVALGCHQSISIAAQLPEGTVWLASQQRFTRLPRWDYQYYECTRTPYAVMITRALPHFATADRVWFVSPRKVASASEHGLALRYVSPGFVERYWVYERGK